MHCILVLPLMFHCYHRVVLPVLKILCRMFHNFYFHSIKWFKCCGCRLVVALLVLIITIHGQGLVPECGAGGIPSSSWQIFPEIPQNYVIMLPISYRTCQYRY